MTAYLVRRLSLAVVLLLAVTFVTFITFFVLPRDPQRVGRGSAGGTADIRNYTNIDKERPFYVQYGEFVWNLTAHHTLGRSFEGHRSVNRIVWNAAPVTASLVIGGAIVWLLVSLPLGVLAALRPRSLLDKGIAVFVLLGISVHPVWLGLVLAYVLGFRLHATPIAGYCEFFTPQTVCGGAVQWGYHLLLPWFAFALLFAALYVRMVRASVLETLQEDYVLTARAKGAGEGQILRRHVLRNALLPVVTMLGMDIGVALGGAVFIEQVFGLPGLGRVAVTALDQQDLPVIAAVVVVMATAIVLFNLVVDLAYSVLDPRVSVVGGGPDPDSAVAPGTVEAKAPAPLTA